MLIHPEIDIRGLSHKEAVLFCVRNSALWIVGRHELDGIMVAFGELGYKFCYSEKGGKITKGQPGWYLPKKKDI